MQRACGLLIVGCIVSYRFILYHLVSHSFLIRLISGILLENAPSTSEWKECMSHPTGTFQRVLWLQSHCRLVCTGRSWPLADWEKHCISLFSEAGCEPRPTSNMIAPSMRRPTSSEGLDCLLFGLVSEASLCFVNSCPLPQHFATLANYSMLVSTCHHDTSFVVYVFAFSILSTRAIWLK